MTLPENINTLEKEKFAAYRGKTAVQTASPVGNSFKAQRTTITTTATQIVMPDKSGKFYLKHNSSGVVIYIGSNAEITTTSEDVWPLAANETIEIDLKAGDANEIYGIVATSTAYIYAAGVCKE
jgi:hypothetical protein